MGLISEPVMVPAVLHPWPERHAAKMQLIIAADLMFITFN
jgi:hypothetical protein